MPAKKKEDKEQCPIAKALDLLEGYDVDPELLKWLNYSYACSTFVGNDNHYGKYFDSLIIKIIKRYIQEGEIDQDAYQILKQFSLTIIVAVSAQYLVLRSGEKLEKDSIGQA